MFTTKTKKSSSEPQTEMGRWLRDTNTYIDQCEREGKKIDWDRVMTQSVNGYAAGIINNDCGADCVFEMPEKLYIHDKHFGILLKALTTKNPIARKGRPDNITFKFPHSKISDNSLLMLASILQDPKCSMRFKLDISGSSAITEQGLIGLLGALRKENCNPGFSIVLPQGRFHQQLVDDIGAQVQANNERYQPPAAKSKKKASPKDKKGWFASKDKKKDESPDKDKKGYKKLSKK